MADNENEGAIKGWNIFACELAAILHAKGYRLGQLDDRAGIHPQRISRLQRSLREPRFHVLPPDDLDSIAKAFDMNEDEKIRLRAAILATAIEEMLMGRIDATDALAAANAIFPLLYAALREHGPVSPSIGAIKGAIAAADNSLGSAELDATLEDALEQLDAATLTVYLASTQREDARSTSIRRASEQLRAARAKLEAMPGAVREQETWLVWHAEVLKGLSAVDQLQAGASK